MKQKFIMTFAMILGLVQGAWAWDGSGTSSAPYQINSTSDWETLCTDVNNGTTYSGKYFELTNNISVTSSLGSNSSGNNYKTFNGTFDGAGNTLTVSYSGSGDCVAPFTCISGATIKNLHITGSISTTGMRPASIASFVVENSTIQNCWSEVAISSSHNSDIDGGGFVARVNENKSLTLTGCAFTGSITYSNANGYEGGGMVGYTQNGATATLTDCLFAPSAISITKYNTSGDAWKKHWMFVGGRVRGNCNNCYYNAVAATAAEAGMVAENKRMHSITAGSYVTIENVTAEATEYNVSGITSYDTGIKYNDVFYAGNSDNVSLTLGYTVPRYTVTSYDPSAGTLTGSSNPYSLTMPDDDVTITATVTVDEWEGTGADWEHAYQIWNSGQLDMLASRVNGESSTTYNDKYYKLMDDITYDDAVANNYTAIGTTVQNQFSHDFNGHFDGQGHTVSGINSVSQWVYYNGLFGKLESGAEVKNIVLANCNIGDGERSGGIAGWSKGFVTGCHVTSTVTVKGTQAISAQHGGIVGANEGTVSHCIFEGVVSKTFSDPNPDDIINVYAYGGIVGINNTNGTLSDNLVISATIPATMHGYGAVVGLHNGTLARNYYTTCTVNGVADATDVGYAIVSDRNIIYGDCIENDGAVPALRNNADNSNAIALMAAASNKLGTYKVQLLGRTLYKDGAWNTLCLPFDVNNFTGTPLAGATVMELGNSGGCNTGFDEATGTLTLDFVDANKIEAGHAYIVKETKPSGYDGHECDVDTSDPVFNGVTVVNEAPANQKVVSQDGYVQFIGTYSPVDIYTAEKTNLYLSAGNNLYYPWGDAMISFNIKSFRAYFQLLKGLTADDPEAGVRSFVLNFGEEETTGIFDGRSKKEDVGLDAWYTLDGRKLDGKPTMKGMYINSGRKVVIK